MSVPVRDVVLAPFSAAKRGERSGGGVVGEKGGVCKWHAEDVHRILELGGMEVDGMLKTEGKSRVRGSWVASQARKLSGKT
jgi:hypothetical protein